MFNVNREILAFTGFHSVPFLRTVFAGMENYCSILTLGCFSPEVRNEHFQWRAFNMNIYKMSFFLCVVTLVRSHNVRILLLVLIALKYQWVFHCKECFTSVNRRDLLCQFPQQISWWCPVCTSNAFLQRIRVVFAKSLPGHAGPNGLILCWNHSIIYDSMITAA